MHSLNPDVTTTSDVDAALRTEALQPLPSKRGEPVFRDSWEAEAFAIGNILVKEGLLSCKEWMDLMAEAIRRAQAAGDPDRGDTYYHHWCTALESFCFERQWISPEIYRDLLSEWGLAIAKTPHGVPLALENAHALTTSGEAPQGHGHAHAHDHSHHHHHHHHHQSGDGPPQHYWRPAHVTRLDGGSSCD